MGERQARTQSPPAVVRFTTSSSNQPQAATARANERKDRSISGRKASGAVASTAQSIVGASPSNFYFLGLFSMGNQTEHRALASRRQNTCCAPQGFSSLFPSAIKRIDGTMQLPISLTCTLSQILVAVLRCGDMVVKWISCERGRAGVCLFLFPFPRVSRPPSESIHAARGKSLTIDMARTSAAQPAHEYVLWPHLYHDGLL
jgi:hypothetical protein